MVETRRRFLELAAAFAGGFLCALLLLRLDQSRALGVLGTLSQTRSSPQAGSTLVQPAEAAASRPAGAAAEASRPPPQAAGSAGAEPTEAAAAEQRTSAPGLAGGKDLAGFPKVVFELALSFPLPEETPFVDRGLHLVLAHSFSSSTWSGVGRLEEHVRSREVARGRFAEIWPRELHGQMRAALAGRPAADVVALDMNGFELEALTQWSAEPKRLPVCSFLVEFQGPRQCLEPRRCKVRLGKEPPLRKLLASLGFSPAGRCALPKHCLQTAGLNCLLGNELFISKEETCADTRAHLLGNMSGRPESCEIEKEWARSQDLRILKWRQGMRERRAAFMNSLGELAKTAAHSYSQSGEDLILLNRYFRTRRGGTFVELGALDGKMFSNTKYYEDTMDWKGVLIEANPETSKKIQGNRPGSTVFRMAVCPEGVGNLTFAGEGGVGGVVDTFSNEHVRNWVGTGKKRVTIPCKPIGSMIREAGLKHVDLFSLDVEGGELAVLETMDWSIKVCVFVVELDGTNPEKDEAVRRLLRSKGYERVDWNIRDTCLLTGIMMWYDCQPNDVFVPSDAGMHDGTCPTGR